MTLDIRGSLKNTKINRNYYVVIDELLSNAIDSYLIRKSYDPAVQSLQVIFDLEFFSRNLEATEFDLKVTCTDNGAGLGQEQTEAFVTKDTSYKDDLAISGIGKCKGSGRIQFLHYFNKLNINSIFKDGDFFNRRLLRVDESVIRIDENSFQVEVTDKTETSTSITLDIIKPDVYERLFAGKDLRIKFSCESLKHYILVAFLQRLVSLKETLGDFVISFNTKYGDQADSIQLTSSELPVVTDTQEVLIPYQDENGVPTEKLETFQLSHYKLDKSIFRLKRNTIALCAKSSIVKLITSKYLKTKTIQNNPVNDFYHIVLIESDYLDTNVNEQRDGFNIPDDSQHTDTFLAKLISYQEIYDAIEGKVIAMLEPPDWDKEKIVKKMENKYGISSSMVVNANVRIRYGDTEETVVKRVLSSYQEEIIKDTSEIFDIKEEISNSDPNSDDFREKVNELAWKYTSSLKSMDMANLSQLVVRRAAIVEILDLAINKGLPVQNVEEGKRQENEKLIHKIFFPMQKDSNETEDHDIWILNEEYQYYDYIASDKALSTFKWIDDQPLFENDIDEELENIFSQNYQGNSKKRPDIAIFSSEGSAIIIEFKAPGVDMVDYTGDLMEYAQLLSAKSGGRLKKFYGYLVGDTLNQNRLRGYTKFPTGKSYFATDKIEEYTTGKNIGEIYSEILFYDDIVDKANKRLAVYKKRLNLSLDS